jgi:6-phosphogluconate dehydrogenase
MIGLGRMGANMVRRLMRGGHECVVYDVAPAAVHALAGEGAAGATELDDFVSQLAAPRTVWLMVPAASVDATLDALVPKLDAGDVVIDGGNSHYRDDIVRAARLSALGLHFVDCGTSGGVLGLERGYCLMIGGADAIVRRLEPVFATLAPGPGSIPRTPQREEPGGTAEHGFLHCGPNGAGHFVKMVHNGIEYGLMAAYAEGLNILKHAGVGAHVAPVDAETTQLRDAAAYQFDFDLANITEPALDGFTGRVSDSGEGRWALQAAMDEAVPAHVLAAALLARFSSRGHADFQNRVLSAMRLEFGGHLEQRTGT